MWYTWQHGPFLLLHGGGGKEVGKIIIRLSLFDNDGGVMNWFGGGGNMRKRNNPDKKL